MTDLIVIYSTRDNKWEGALLWAKESMTKTVVKKECCYRGPNQRATHVYSTSAAILSDYSHLDVEVLDL